MIDSDKILAHYLELMHLPALKGDELLTLSCEKSDGFSLDVLHID